MWFFCSPSSSCGLQAPPHYRGEAPISLNYAGRYAPLHPAQGFLCEKALNKSAFKEGRTTRDIGEVRPPLKTPCSWMGILRKIDSLQSREGIRSSGKILRSRRLKPLRRIFRAHPLWRTDRGTGVSPAGLVSARGPLEPEAQGGVPAKTNVKENLTRE